MLASNIREPEKLHLCLNNSVFDQHLHRESEISSIVILFMWLKN